MRRDHLIDRGRCPRRAVAGVVGFGAAFVFAACSATASPPMSPTAFVTAATNTTMTKATAKFSVSGTMEVEGRTLPTTGSGEVDFATGALSMTVSATVGVGESIDATDLMFGGTTYMGLTIGGQSLQQVSGYSGVKLPFSTTCVDTGVTGANLVSQIRYLISQGATVTPLGRSTIGGPSVQGYSVQESKQQASVDFAKYGSKCGLTAAQISAARTVVVKAPIPALKVWYSDDQLLRRMAVTVSLGLSSTSGFGGEQATMDFSDYGTPVHLAAPAGSDVMSYQQFQHFLSSQGSPRSGG